VGKLRMLSRCHTARKINEDYIVTSESLGSGMNGHVRLATSRLDSSREFAVKSFSLRSLSAAQRHQIEMEVTLSLSMDHPNIVRVMDAYEYQGRLDLVMERMEGGELFDRAQQKHTFSELEAADVARQILAALSHMHARGVAHRDVKLENVMFERSGGDHMKMVDLGVADVLRFGRLKGLCGTPEYVAPEVWHSHYTERCDLWSLGVVVYILLSGQMPFSGSDAKLYALAAKGQYSMDGNRWHGVSSEARAFIQALLEVDPVRRISAQQALALPWITRATRPATVAPSTVAALRAFPSLSQFERCSLRMIALMLSPGEEEVLRAQFLALDRKSRGTVSLQDLKSALAVRQGADDHWVQETFSALCSSRNKCADDEVCYSDFLAAMIPSHLCVGDNLLRSAFRKFDVHDNGTITGPDLERLCSDFEGTGVEALVREASASRSSAINFPEFVTVMRGGQRRRQITTAQFSVPITRPTLLGMHGPPDGMKFSGTKFSDRPRDLQADPLGQDMSCSDKDRSCAGGCAMQ